LFFPDISSLFIFLQDSNQRLLTHIQRRSILLCEILSSILSQSPLFVFFALAEISNGADRAKYI